MEKKGGGWVSMVNLPDDWQDNFTGADNLKCLTLYPSEDDLNLLRKRSGRNKESISAAVRKAVDGYLKQILQLEVFL